jgi:nicotinate phosphoribosyltransferase
VGARIDLWGVATELGVSRDAPALGGVYKLVADRDRSGAWRSVSKRSPAKSTIPGPKQRFRAFHGGAMAGDLVVEASEEPSAAAVADAAQERRALLERFVQGGEIVRAESLIELRARTQENLAALPAALRSANGCAPRYPVSYSESPLAKAGRRAAPHAGARAG